MIRVATQQSLLDACHLQASKTLSRLVAQQAQAKGGRDPRWWDCPAQQE